MNSHTPEGKKRENRIHYKNERFFQKVKNICYVRLSGLLFFQDSNPDVLI